MTSVEPLETTGAAISNDSAVLTPTEAGDDDRTPDGLVNGSGSTTNGADVTSKRRRSRSEAFEEVDGEGQEQETPDATRRCRSSLQDGLRSTHAALLQMTPSERNLRKQRFL